MPAPHEKSDTPQVCYSMAYFLLPQYCSDRPDSLLQNLNLGPTAGAAFFYAMTCQINELEPRDDVIHALSVSTGELNETTKYYIIAYPEPPNVNLTDIPDDNILDAMQKIVLAPYFSAILEDAKEGKLTYFILGQSPDGFTTLRTIDGTMNANLGRGCEPQLEAFVELLRSKTDAG